MADIEVISFSEKPLDTAKRRLSDLPERVVEGDPHHTTDLHFKSPDGILISGTWTSTPGKWKVFTSRDEFCVILSGCVQIISECGIVKEFKTGDAFQIPNGFRGYWKIIETTTKHFVIRQLLTKT